MVWAEFTRLEFVAADGRSRTFCGCSVVGLFEFYDRLAELEGMAAAADPDTPIIELYQGDPKFRHACDRALVLNGIQPEWVTPSMLIQLLFPRLVDGEPRDAYLKSLNEPYRPKRKTKGIPVEGKAGLIAAIASHTGNIAEAYELARTVPARELMAVIDEVAQLRRSPEEREQAGFDDWAAKARAQVRARSAA